MSHSDTSAEAFAAHASEALRAGNYLLCYDLVDQALQLGLQTRRLQYLSLLALANAGSTEFAGVTLAHAALPARPSTRVVSRLRLDSNAEQTRVPLKSSSAMALPLAS